MDSKLKPYYKLNIDFPFLKDDIYPFQQTESTSTNKEWIAKSISADILSDDMRIFAKRQKFKIHTYGGEETLIFFQGEPNHKLAIHVDRGTNWGINYVYGTTNSEMVWYKFKNEDASQPSFEIPTSDAIASYKCYHDSQVYEIDRAKLHGLYLVRIDLPHAVHNYDNLNHRCCLTIKDMNNRWTWEQAVMNFKEYLEND